MNERITSAESTIGIDLGDRKSEVCFLDDQGKVTRRKSVATTSSAVQRLFESIPGSRVVMEAGTHSPWLSRLLSKLGHNVIVANPRQVRLIGQSVNKDDKRDAELLARLGRVDPKLLAPIQHRGVKAQQDRGLLQVRASLIEVRTKLINQVRGLAKACGGERVPACKGSLFAAKARLHLEGQLFVGQDVLLSQIETLSATLKELDQSVERMCREEYPETARLRQIAGMGPLTSLTYVLALESPDRFARSRSVGAYLGLTPRRRDSGERHPELRITKAGDTALRQLLVQCAQHILGPFGPDSDLRRLGERLIAQGGKRAKKRAVVAVARRLAVLSHALWRSGETYDPLRHATA